MKQIISLTTACAVLVLQAAVFAQDTDAMTHCVRFNHGRNSATIVGTMMPSDGMTDKGMTTYVVKAHKGQTLAVRLKSSDKRVFFNVMNPAFDVNRDNDLLYWYRPIKKSGEYDIRVVSDKYGDHLNKTCTYTLQIKLSGH
jgi:hypothetical protein